MGSIPDQPENKDQSQASSSEPQQPTADELEWLSPDYAAHRGYVGPGSEYDFMGATQFRLLTTLGLREEHYLLDIGCGSLRSGRLIIPYLLSGRYHGIEPNRWLIEQAVKNEIGQSLLDIKQPRFDHNSDFDVAVFGRRFDFIVAQSIFSHTGRDLTRRGIAALKSAMLPTSLAIVSFRETMWGAAEEEREGWIYPGTVAFHANTITSFITEARLFGQRLAWFHPRLVWYLIAGSRAAMLTPSELAVVGHGMVVRDGRFAPPQAPTDEYRRP